MIGVYEAVEGRGWGEGVVLYAKMGGAFEVPEDAFKGVPVVKSWVGGVSGEFANDKCDIWSGTCSEVEKAA